MPVQYHSNILAQMDGRLLQLKEYLINAVSTEMQDQSIVQQQNREAVRGLLLEAYERTKADLKPEVRDRAVDSALADLLWSARIAAP
jgi:hypothetical protein